VAGLLKSLACATLAGLTFFTIVSLGSARPDARTMTCSEVQALIAREGSVTLSTGANTYDRYYAVGACDGTRVAKPATIATEDTGACQVHTCGARVRRID
jgi:hypothetical protein